MATKAVIPVEEYLRTSFEGPDREFVDGEVVERNAGENPHSAAQARLIELFYELRRKYPLYSLPELRLKLSARRYRIPDLAVFAGEQPAEDVPSSPPLIVVEIVSRDDRYTDVIKKLEEYHGWGVAHVWLVDPWMRKLYVYTGAGLSEVAAFEIPEHNARIRMDDVF
ncbi:MAG: Uma2 family endonuclease [Acidobacteriota bacterium]